MKESDLIHEAKKKIEAVKGRSLSILERKEAAISLAALILEEAQRVQTSQEKQQQQQLAGMVKDPIGKVFTTAITDQCFRSHRAARVANQLIYLINKYGIPSYLPFSRRVSLQVFKWLGQPLARFLVPLVVEMLRRETSHVILPGEEKSLVKHIQKRHAEGVRVNLNHLGEAILGEEEAHKRLHIYLEDLAKPDIEYISVKISTIYSQINLLAWKDTLNVLADRLRQLYREAIKHQYKRPDGQYVSKFVNLDMEEYRDLALTVALFRKVLDEPEFYSYSAGIVLQSYLPDSYFIQQELTSWAIQRVAQGGAPIKIRLVKGANLAMEQVEAALRLWPQTPYSCKADVDANYKRMVNEGCQKEHVQAAHLGIASHNLFDIAYALLLRAENGVENEVSFEMLEGMADPMRRVVQQLAGGMLLYCPAASKSEFQNAVAYLVRRLDENTAPENFLRHAFDLKPGSEEWQHQADLFSRACLSNQEVSSLPSRTQNRLTERENSKELALFQNEPDTDWSLAPNRQWAEKIINDWKHKKINPIPIVIGDESIGPGTNPGIGRDPSYPAQEFYHYTLATSEQIDKSLATAKAAELTWSQLSIKERSDLLGRIAVKLRKSRSELIGAMIADTGKTIQEADIEVSEAIDFADYYRFNSEEWASLIDIQWKPKGTILVAPPWNFPCSIPAGGILASLATGNCVIFKPASESVLVGWILVQLFWEAGISPHVLQFMTCEDEPIGSQLVKAPEISTILLTGSTATAKLFLKLKPGLDLIAETGGKNTMVITGVSDRDLAIRDLIHSAFSHAGQKCSACSLAILEAEVYDDLHFRKQLKDATASYCVGSPWNAKTKMGPLIREANPVLKRALTELEEGEEWLLEPKQDPHNPNLWSPGIKLGVKPDSFTFQNELFGPVLGLVRAKNINHAFEMMNQTPYGLTAGIHSLDEREQHAWLEKIEAGNCYINRTMTGAIVQRQPFGGCKDSSFGKGAKAGGPNYLAQLMNATQTSLPKEQIENKKGAQLTAFLEINTLSSSEREVWEASLGSYAFYWSYYFSKDHDPSHVLGQDNFQRYLPHSSMTFRVQKKDSLLDTCRVLAAALTCGTFMEISTEKEDLDSLLLSNDKKLPFLFIKETEKQFIDRIKKGYINRLRLLRDPENDLVKALSEAACHLNTGPVLANGRLELLHYLREVSVSRDYHRYGNLGEREKEKRISTCGMYECDE